MNFSNTASESLPAINVTFSGKKAFKIYQQGLEHNFQPIRNQPEPSRQELRPQEARSYQLNSRHMTSVISELSNIQELLREDGDMAREDIYDMLESDKKMTNQPKKDLPVSISATFYKNGVEDSRGLIRPITSGTISQQGENRISPKKQKDFLRSSEKISRVSSSCRTFGSGEPSPPKRIFEISGKKLSMQEENNFQRSHSWKLYLKKMKEGPYAMNFSKTPATEQKLTTNASEVSNVKPVKPELKRVANSSHYLKKSLNKTGGKNDVKIKTVTMDGESLNPSIQIKTPHIHTMNIPHAADEYTLANFRITPSKVSQIKLKRFHIKLPVNEPLLPKEPEFSKYDHANFNTLKKEASSAYLPHFIPRADKQGVNNSGIISERPLKNDYFPQSHEDKVKSARKINSKGNASDFLKNHPYYQEETLRTWHLTKNSLKADFPKIYSDIKGKKAQEEVMALHSNLSKAMNRSKEKLLIEEMKDASPRQKEIQSAFEKIAEIRKWAPPKELRRKKQKPQLSTGIDSRRKTAHEIESLKSFNMYQMTYAEDIDNPQFNLNKSASKLNVSSLNGFNNEFATADTAGLADKKSGASKVQIQDPFNALIMFQNKKMPFSLAVMAKTRQRIINEVKNRPLNPQERKKPEQHLRSLRDKLVPEEKAKFLEQLDETEKKKKYEEMKSKKANTSTIYQLAALNKTSQMRLKAKMKEHFPVNSRFLNL